MSYIAQYNTLNVPRWISGVILLMDAHPDAYHISFCIIYNERYSNLQISQKYQVPIGCPRSGRGLLSDSVFHSFVRPSVTSAHIQWDEIASNYGLCDTLSDLRLESHRI